MSCGLCSSGRHSRVHPSGDDLAPRVELLGDRNALVRLQVVQRMNRPSEAGPIQNGTGKFKRACHVRE